MCPLEVESQAKFYESIIVVKKYFMRWEKDHNLRWKERDSWKHTTRVNMFLLLRELFSILY